MGFLLGLVTDTVRDIISSTEGREQQMVQRLSFHVATQVLHAARGTYRTLQSCWIIHLSGLKSTRAS